MNLRLLTCLLLALPGQAQDGILSPTFDRDVAPILFHRCSTCHRPGEIGPFSLLTYADVRKRSKQILDVIETRQMPPWKPEPGYGEFIGELRLPDPEIALLKKWVEQGSVEGDPKDLPPVPAPVNPEDWEFGKPDLILKLPEPYTIGAEERNTYRAFVIPMNLTEDKYLQAFQFRPSNPRSVHHALFYVDASGAFRRQAAADPSRSIATETVGLSFLAGGTLGAWSPGGGTPPFGKDRAMLVKKDSDVILHLHFSPTGKVEKEQSRLGLWFAKTPPKHPVAIVTQTDPLLFVPAGESKARYNATIQVPVDIDVIGIHPHAHYLATDCRMFATTPEGREIPLIWIKHWDFEWQKEYRFKEAVRIPKGSQMTSRWTYDNSSGNPRNPWNPPQDIHFGFRSEDEMSLMTIRVLPNRPEDVLKMSIALKVIKR